MQNAKDSFYMALRNRLATLAPQRVITLRGVQRPAIVVEEAEAPVGELPSNCYVVRWTGQTLVSTPCATLICMTCEVLYATSGSQANAGLDRGRALAAMDAELLEICQPGWAAKTNYGTTPASAMQTQVFWSEPTFGALKTVRDQLSRVATISLFSYQEPGEQ